MNLRDELHDELAALRGEALVRRLFVFLEEAGQSHYDEVVTQLEHALQSAELARESGANAPLIASALLHDVGHLLAGEHDANEDFLFADLQHEAVGADFLAEFFPEEVCAPIRLHVPAKRYLCTVDQAYVGGLSPASVRSFQVQGGPLSEKEKADYEQSPYLPQALQLRRWDDGAKTPDHPTAPLIDFLPDVVASLRREYRV